MFGGAERLKEAHRDARGTRWLEDLVSDARYAMRALRQNWALTIAAVGTLALVIGANTAIFSAVDAVLLRPLPFAKPDRLVMAGENNREFLWHMADAAPANYLDWRSRVPAFSDAMAYADFPLSVTLMVDGAPRLAPAAIVTGNFFSVLGVTAQIGRTLRDDETWRGGANVVVISDRLWRPVRATKTKERRSFGAAPTVVGWLPSFRFPRPHVSTSGLRWPKEQLGDFLSPRALAAWWRAPKPGVSRGRGGTARDVAQQLKVEYPTAGRIMGAEWHAASPRRRPRCPAGRAGAWAAVAHCLRECQ
jgi:hypothetical protein